MNGIQVAPDALLDVTIRLGRTHVFATLPTRLQVLVETRPSARTSHVTAPTDIRLVVDVSGSMNEPSRKGGASKLEVVKTAIITLLAQLTDSDSVLLSVFSTNGRLVVPQTRLTPEARQRVERSVQELQPEGSTNISAGLKLALEAPSARGALPRVILFTDGQSTSYPQRDHQRLVELADMMRSREIPLLVYGTGSDYNWSLLHQVATRAGGVSFLKHVMDVASLEGHMLAELAFLRGTAIDRFEIEGVVTHGVTLVCATSMMPQIRKIEITHQRSFLEHTGALDLHRGAQYLIELEVAQPTPGKRTVLFLTFHGRNRTTLVHLDHMIEVPVTFVAYVSQQSPVDEQVRKVLLMLAAAKEAEAGTYGKAAALYRRGGDEATATVMEGLDMASRRGDANSIDLERAAMTVASGVVTDNYTIDPGTGRGKC
ncbi:MAG: VWA domain-containing protein [Candidatus Uhrbacteria bacterium]|nr:VWA domain-containing protein [Candidatus Uhrbacteria bacterium]